MGGFQSNFSGSQNSGMSNVKYGPEYTRGGEQYRQGTEVSSLNQKYGLLYRIGPLVRYRFEEVTRDFSGTRSSNNRYGKIVSGSVLGRGDLPYVDSSSTHLGRYSITPVTSSDGETVINKAQILFPEGSIRQLPNYYISFNSLGAGAEYRKTTPYTDLCKYDAVDYISQGGQLYTPGMFPVVGDTPSYTEDFVYNGIIEPFDIRSKLYGKYTFLLTERSPSGGIYMDILNTTIDKDKYKKDEITKDRHAPTEDIAPRGFSGNTNSESIIRRVLGLLEPEYVSELVTYIEPYRDTDRTNLIKFDNDLNNVLLCMHPMKDEGERTPDDIDYSSGFDGFAGQRFDSSTYRGLLR